jgi:hypothetical protein
VTDRPDPPTLNAQELDRAEVELERQYRVPSHVIAKRPGDPEGVPADVLAWWRAADKRRRQLIYETRGEPVHVTDDIEPMERRRERLKKPGPPR